MKLCEEFREYEKLWEAADSASGMEQPRLFHNRYYDTADPDVAAEFVLKETNGKIVKLKKACRNLTWTEDDSADLAVVKAMVAREVALYNHKGYPDNANKIKEVMDPIITDIESKSQIILNGLKSDAKVSQPVRSPRLIPQETIDKLHKNNTELINILNTYTDISSKADVEDLLAQLDKNRLADYSAKRYIAFGR